MTPRSAIGAGLEGAKVMNTKHTPGPWVLDGVDIYPVGGHPLDPICAMSPGQGDAFQSNAQLIAAAPDLLAALEELADLVDDIVWGNYKPDSFTTQPARAAIAKATGGES